MPGHGPASCHWLSVRTITSTQLVAQAWGRLCEDRSRDNTNSHTTTAGGQREDFQCSGPEGQCWRLWQTPHS